MEVSLIRNKRKEQWWINFINYNDDIFDILPLYNATHQKYSNTINFPNVKIANEFRKEWKKVVYINLNAYYNTTYWGNFSKNIRDRQKTGEKIRLYCHHPDEYMSVSSHGHFLWFKTKEDFTHFVMKWS